MGEIAAPAAPTCWWSPTTTRAPRTRPRSGPRCWPARARRRRRGEVVEVGRPPGGDRRGGRAGRARATWSLVAGKGHERGQEIAGVVHPFDDRVELAAALRDRFGDRRRAMIALTLAEIADGGRRHAAGGRPGGRGRPAPVEFDSRTVGARRAVRRLRRRAGRRARLRRRRRSRPARSAVLGTRPVAGVPTVVVDDALAALGRAGPGRASTGCPDADRRRRSPARRARPPPRTCSRQLLRRLGPTVGAARLVQQRARPAATPCCRPTRDTRFLVLEMGARGVGHIALPVRDRAARIGRGAQRRRRAHRRVRLGRGDRRRPRASWSRRCRPTAAGRAQRRRPAGARDGGAHRAPGWSLVGEAAGRRRAGRRTSTLDDRGRPAFTLVTPDGPRAGARCGWPARTRSATRSPPRRWRRELGMPLAERRRGARRAAAASRPRRMEVFDRADGVTVIDDAYNANPASMAAALRALAAIGAAAGGPSAVLGYMAELGEYERAGHDEVGRLAAELGVDRLVVVGEPAAPIHDGAAAVADWGGESVLRDRSGRRRSTLLRSELRPGDVVLVKGSRYRTWDVADALRAGRPATGGRPRVRAVIVAAVVGASSSRCSAPRSRSGASPGSRPASRSATDGPDDAPGQEGHAHDGRRRLHRRHGDRLRRRRTSR